MQNYNIPQVNGNTPANLYLMNNCSPVFNQTANPVKNSHISYTFSIVGAAALIWTILVASVGGFIGHDWLQGGTYSNPSITYNYYDDFSPHNFSYTLDNNQAVVVGALNIQDIQNNTYYSNGFYAVYNGPGKVNLNITHGYIEIVSPKNYAYIELCGHVKIAIDNNWPHQYVYGSSYC